MHSVPIDTNEISTVTIANENSITFISIPNYYFLIKSTKRHFFHRFETEARTFSQTNQSDAFQIDDWFQFQFFDPLVCPRIHIYTLSRVHNNNSSGGKVSDEITACLSKSVFRPLDYVGIKVGAQDETNYSLKFYVEKVSHFPVTPVSSLFLIRVRFFGRAKWAVGGWVGVRFLLVGAQCGCPMPAKQARLSQNRTFEYSPSKASSDKTTFNFVSSRRRGLGG